MEHFCYEGKKTLVIKHEYGVGLDSDLGLEQGYLMGVPLVGQLEGGYGKGGCRSDVGWGVTGSNAALPDRQVYVLGLLQEGLVVLED